METTIEKIQQIIRTAIKKDIEIDSNELLENVVTSSLKFVIMLGEIERVFNIDIPEDQMDLKNFKTINTIHELINRLQTVNL